MNTHTVPMPPQVPKTLPPPLRPHGVWIVAGGLAVTGLALAGVLTWNAAVGAERPLEVVEAAPVKPVRPAKPKVVNPVKPVAVACATCGVVEGVQAVKRKGEATGVGAVAGGVTGAVLGQQVGKGNGKTAMTVIGAVGGGVAGHEIEKQVRANTVYEVTVRMNDGSLRTVEQPTPPRVGQRVRMDGKSMTLLAGPASARL